MALYVSANNANINETNIYSMKNLKVGILSSSTKIELKNRLHQKYNIKTIDDLENFQSNIETKLNKKLEQRQKLYNKIRRCKDTDLKSKLQTEAKSYSKEIKELRKQMKLCNGIEERSKQMEQTISTIQEKERGKNRYERY